MSTLFKGVYYFLAILVDEHTIQGSIVFKGAYYLRKYGTDFLTHISNESLYLKDSIQTRNSLSKFTYTGSRLKLLLDAFV